MTVVEKYPTPAEIELRAVEPSRPMTLFGSDDPEEFLAQAGRTAASLKKMLVECKLVSSIQSREYVRVEGWTALGSMLGVFPVTEYTRPIEVDGATGWEARVQVVTRDGTVIGAAEAMCLRSERSWKSRDEFALRSMAATRATSKALRQPLGFVISMAGYEATPAEEMVVEATPAKTAQPQPATTTEPKASKDQVADIAALILVLREQGMSLDALEEGMRSEYQTAEPSELTQAQAEDFLARLKKKAAEAPPV